MGDFLKCQYDLILTYFDVYSGTLQRQFFFFFWSHQISPLVNFYNSLKMLSPYEVPPMLEIKKYTPIHQHHWYYNGILFHLINLMLYQDALGHTIGVSTHRDE